MRSSCRAWFSESEHEQFVLRKSKPAEARGTAEGDVAYPVARHFPFCRVIASLLPRDGW